MSVSRVKTYIAADWDHDKDFIKILKKILKEIMLEENSKGKDLKKYFTDIHEKIQISDNNPYCIIKKSLDKRLKMSKVFILIVGKHTNKLKKGICSFCKHYNKKRKTCSIGNDVDKRSYIKYECYEAIDKELKIIVIYKNYDVDRKKCPKILREEGTHIPAYTLTKKSPQSIKIDKDKFLNFPEIVTEIVGALYTD